MAADASSPSPGLTDINSVAGQKRKRTAERKFYAVQEGKKPGVYNSWPECLAQVKGHKGAMCTRFPHGNLCFISQKTPTDTPFSLLSQSRLSRTYMKLKLS
jgi:hypothetical protein